MTDLTVPIAGQPSPTHDGNPAQTRPPRPSVTSRAIAQARTTLATAERRIIRARGNQRWRLTMSIDAARATLRAGGIA